MALRLNWGDQPNFALAVGGFHPDYPYRRVSLRFAGSQWTLERTAIQA